MKIWVHSNILEEVDVSRIGRGISLFFTGNQFVHILPPKTEINLNFIICY